MTRLTGETTRQMQKAPANAIFIWWSNDLYYPRKLAQHLGRHDLTILGPAYLWPERMIDLFDFKPLVLDHWVKPTPSQWEAIEYYRARVESVGTLSQGDKETVCPS